jgi:signal transduction histidine kinase
MTEPRDELPPTPPSISLPATDMGRRFRETDWAATGAGQITGWPQSLQIATNICMNSRFPMFVWWGASLVNIYNDAYAPMLGKRHPDAFGKPAQATWQDIWPVIGPQAEAVMREGRSTWNERVLLVMERNGFPEDTWFTWSYSPIYAEDGSIGGLFCACTEETARVVAERERDALVREAQHAARTLHTWFDHAPGFIALLRGPDFIFEMVNQAYYQLVGHRQIEGLPVFEALPEVRNQGYEERLRDAYTTGVPFLGRALPVLFQKEPQGPLTQAYIDLLYQPVRDAQGQVVGLFAQGHDVTEQVLATQALKDADRRKDEFLATLAHELRNPLAPIRQAATLARSPQVDAGRRGWALDVIERQSSHMSLLLDDLLDVSRISRGRLELRREAVNLRDVVSAALETARPGLDRKGHGVEVDLPREQVVLQADPIRLSQVLSNLLSNAGKYTDHKGHIQLRAAIDGDQVVIRVIDDGIGLEAGAQGQIFEMFTQVSTDMGRAEGGLGIGLALSRGLVLLHGGTITVHSAGLGQGTEFVIHLPLGQDQSGAAASAPQAGAGSRCLDILIADDNEDARETLSAVLALHGHTTHVAADGQEALAMAQKLRPAVAILDIGMPGLTGYQVAQGIRAAPWGQDMQLIALTGWGQAQDQALAHAAGFDHHVTKPVDLARLEQLIAPA